MTTAAKLYGKDLSDYDDVDVDELLSQLTPEEINILAKEVDPDVSLYIFLLIDVLLLTLYEIIHLNILRVSFYLSLHFIISLIVLSHDLSIIIFILNCKSMKLSLNMTFTIILLSILLLHVSFIVM